MPHPHDLPASGESDPAKNAGAELVIDCHGHFTTEPAAFHDFRRAQIAHATGGPRPSVYAGIDDEELSRIIGANQLRVQQERGTDLTLLSPRASGMGHHIGGADLAREWARVSNDTIARIRDLFPDNFAAVCQLPQTVEGDLSPVIAELERCVELGFVGCNVNPDPSGGRWSAPPLTDRWWDPLWEALAALRVPAMIHVSASSLAAVHTTGASYLSADTTVFMQLLEGDLFERHPDLRLVIPHGGGAVPYHWGRFRGMALARGKAPLERHLLRNVFFDTCVYHQAGIDLLFEVIDPANILFGSELLGAVKEIDPETGHPFDDTLRYIDELPLSASDRRAVLAGNARRVYPRLDAQLTARGR
ncbi:MAG: amidohydrolase family protein [Microbacterium sp.]|uniref:amidohydrolase family protein n=1 Tax=Microbacterium sp. TaxID=51671 RepID=UPI0026017A47|nr:amidohydrolase family protein [Microbacterium sp.]MCX6501463.1 amidohydrolase family protein [Microbacterium sp.]